MSLYIDPKRFFDTKDTELKSLGSKQKIALDQYGRIIISQYDYCHFEEKLAQNPCPHFWNHFGVVPDKERDIGYENVIFDTAGRGFAKVQPGGYFFTHQPFRYGVFKFLVILPKPEPNVKVYVGLADVHPTEFEPLSFISNVYLKIDGTRTIIGCEGYGGQETYVVTPNVIYEDYTLLTFEVYEDIVKFYHKNTLLGSIFADAFIKKLPQRTGVMSLVVKNEGTYGEVIVDLITAEPSIEHKAPRTVLRNIGLSTNEQTIYGYTCIVDKIILANYGEADGVATIKDGEGYIFVKETVPVGKTSCLDLGGLPFKYGIKAVCNYDYTIVAHFIGTF